MKKIILFLAVSLTGFLWAQSLSDFYFMYGGDWYLKGGEKLSDTRIDGNDTFAVCDADSGNKVAGMFLCIDKNGYVKLNYKDKETLLLGNNVGLLSETENNTDYALPSIVKSISSETFLTETLGGKTIEYRAENLLKSVVWGALENPYAYNSKNTPFVPKDNGKKGIGTKITINLKKAKNRILILGGYADPLKHPDYYHKNCRPKTIRIKDLDSDYSVTCEMQDAAVFHAFDFSKPLSNIELEVIDVYEGSKYSDLCISGIIFK